MRLGGFTIYSRVPLTEELVADEVANNNSDCPFKSGRNTCIYSESELILTFNEIIRVFYFSVKSSRKLQTDKKPRTVYLKLFTDWWFVF